MAHTRQKATGSRKAPSRTPAAVKTAKVSGSKQRKVKAMVNSIITTALGSHGPLGDTIAGAASRDWSTLPHASTLADRVLGLPEADDPAVDAWTPYHASDILHPKRARIIPLAEPTNPLLQRGIPLAGAYEPFGARAADKTAHSLNLRRTGVPPSLTNPTYAPDNPRSDSNGWFREEIDDADDGFVHLEPNKVYLSYNSDFNTPSDPTDNPLLYYDLLPDPEPLPSSIPSPQPPPPSSSSPVSNFNSLSALCGLDEEGIHNYLGEELYGHFDQIRELVVGDPTKGIPSFLELNPINNTKGKTAFNLGGVWIIYGSGIGSVSTHAAGEGELAERIRQINALAMPIAVKMLEKVLTKRELELLRAESDLRNSATMEGLWQKYFTSAQLNISFPGEDITVSLGIFGKLHVDKKDHPSGLTVVIDVSHLYEGQYPGGGAHIPSGLFMNTPGYSVFAFRGVEPHLPLNPKERVRGADPLVDEKGRKYCRITIVCYINENLFCRRDANDQPFPLASDIPQVVGMSSTEATYYKTYTHDGHGFWGVPLGKALVKLETLETGDLGIAQTRLNKRIDTLQQSRLASALFIERERAMIDYYRDLDATSTNPNVRVPVVETFANETIEERLRCRSYRDAWGDVCSLADALTPETLFLGTPKGTIWLARIERQKKLGASFIHELPKSRVDGGDDEGDVMDVAEKGPVFVQVGARLGEIVEEIEAARANANPSLEDNNIEMDDEPVEDAQEEEDRVEEERFEEEGPPAREATPLFRPESPLLPSEAEEEESMADSLQDTRSETAPTVEPPPIRPKRVRDLPPPPPPPINPKTRSSAKNGGCVVETSGSQPGAIAIRFPPIKDGVPTTAVLVPRFAALQDTLEQILEQIEANPRAFATRLTTQDLLEEVERSMLASSASESKLTQEEIIGLATRTTLVTRQLSIDDSMRIVILYHARMFVISSHITNARLVLQFYPAFARDALSRFGTPSSPTDTVVAASNSAVDQLTAFVYNTITPYLGQPRPRKSKNITIPLTIVQSLVQLPVASVEKILLALRNNTLVPSLSFTFYEKLTSSSFDDYFLYVITDLLTKALSIPTCRALERYTDRLEEGFVGKEAEALSFDGLVEDEEAASETKRRITQRYDIIKGLTGSDGQHIDLSIFALPELLSFLHRPLQYYKQSMAYSPALLLLANNCRRGGHLSLSDGMLAVLGKQMRAVGKSIKLIAAVEKVEEVLTKVRSALGSKKGGKGKKKKKNGKKKEYDLDPWTNEPDNALKLAAAYMSECAGMHASFDPHNIGIVDVVGANPDKLFAFPEQTPSMRWLHKRLPLVPSLDSPSQLLLVSIVRQCCYGRIAPPVSTKPWSEELYTFLETFDTPTHPEGWRGTVARMNDDQLRTKLAELRVDMISNRRAYGSPTSVTPANVAAVATYGHHFQARLRASADKSWFAALTAYRSTPNLPFRSPTSLIGHVTMSAIAACFPNDVTPATISEMSKMVDRGARAGLHLFDPTIGKLEDKSDEEQNDVARLSYEVIGNFFEHGAHHSFKTLLQFGGQLMENTPCKMTRVAQKGGFKKVHKPTDDDCLFSSRFFELYETWTTRDRRNAATSQAILDEIAALPATPFALRVAAAWETDKATFRGRTEEEEVALDAAFKLADEHKSWDEVRKAGEKGVDVGKAWWGKGYEEVESGTALAGRVAKELAKEKAGSQDDSEGAERPQKRKKTTHPKKLSSTPVTSTTASLPKSTRSAAKAQRPKREATKLNKKSYKDVVSDSESPGEYDSSDENSSDESDDEVLGSEMEDDDGSREEGRSGGLEDIDELEQEEEAVTTEEEDSDDDDPEEDLTTTSLSEWKEQQEARGLGVDEDWVDV